MSLRILIPEPNTSTGKGSFFTAIKKYWLRDGHIVVHDAKQSHDVYLDTVKFRMDSSAPRILRLDGAYYNISKKAHIFSNKEILKQLNLAHGVIYQSNFSKRVCDHFVGMTRSKYAVIHNGADMSMIKDAEPARSDFSCNFFTAARWRSPKRLFQIVKTFLKWKNEDAALWIAGKPDVNVPAHPRVFMLGALDKGDIISYMKMADAFIHFCWVDSCPNGVVEALCSGCPVICNNRGGTPEIVQDRGIIVDLDEPYNFKKFDPDNPPTIDQSKVIKAYDDILNRSFSFSAQDLSAELAASRYISFFKEVLHG